MVLMSQCYSNDNTLQLVIGIFRHGDRTVDKMTVYPKDPYVNYTYYPYGYGELTNAGKRRLYNLGKKLRKKYEHFLDAVYTPDLLYATSTKPPRTKVSLLMLLAGLFPPLSTGFEWDDHINWTPIPFTSDEEINHIPPFFYCREFQDLHNAYLETEEVQQRLKHFEKWFPYLSYHTGIKMRSYFNIVQVYYHLKIQKEIGMKIPLWSFPVFPEPLKNVSTFYLNTFTATKELRQLYGGKFLLLLIDIMKQKMNGTLSPINRKLFLFSAHDINVLTTLSALNTDIYEVPPYGACLLLELHKKKTEYFLRIFYEDYTSDDMKQLNINGCSQDCQFDQFLELVHDNLPVDNSLCNDSSTAKDPLED